MRTFVRRTCRMRRIAMGTVRAVVVDARRALQRSSSPRSSAAPPPAAAPLGAMRRSVNALDRRPIEEAIRVRNQSCERSGVDVVSWCEHLKKRARVDKVRPPNQAAGTPRWRSAQLERIEQKPHVLGVAARKSTRAKLTEQVESTAWSAIVMMTVVRRRTAQVEKHRREDGRVTRRLVVYK